MKFEIEIPDRYFQSAFKLPVKPPEEILRYKIADGSSYLSKAMKIKVIFEEEI